jgi:uncharacterized protein involved in outer membrane biogenesis
MAKIFSPNTSYNGVSATVSFVDGRGETNNPDLIVWFKENGYHVYEVDSDNQAESTPDVDWDKQPQIDADQLTDTNPEAKTEATEPEKVGADVTEPAKVEAKTEVAEPEKVEVKAELAKVEVKAEPAKVEVKAEVTTAKLKK